MPKPFPAVEEAAIATAVHLLQAGRLVAFPTETVYGLGANALDADAVARIYAVKGRPATSPLIVHVCSIEMAQPLVARWPDTAARLSRKFWPGPLTLVLEKSMEPDGDGKQGGPAAIPDIVTAGLRTVGLRLPAHPVAVGLIRAAGIPLAAPSANRFTHLSPTTADHVRSSLGNEVDYILDGGPCKVGIESTVLSLAGSRPILLRPGGISRAQLESEVGSIAVQDDVRIGAHPSPGMHARHYSPRTPLFLASQGEVPEAGKGIYLQHRHRPSRFDLTIIEMPDSPAEYAAALYQTLHRSDDAGSDWIAVDQPPDSPDWEAVQDRLRRASSK